METANERFDGKYAVDKASGCWLWAAGRTGAGYGAFYLEGRMAGAHRVSYERHVGPVPEGLELDHLCRVRNCVNPKHLEPVTRKENLRRGVGAAATAARCAAITHCPQGHPYSGDNLYLPPGGGRRCRTCSRRSCAKYQKGNPDKHAARARAFRRKHHGRLNAAGRARYHANRTKSGASHEE